MLRELKGSMATERGRARAHRRKMIKATFFTVGIFLMLATLGAVGYIWYIGNAKPAVVATLPDPVSRTITKEKPKVVDPNAPVSIAEQAFTTPVVAGENASLTIRTRPEAACTITVTYDKVKSTDAGLVPKTADEFGNVQWTWTVEPSRPPGKWPVEVTCALNNKSSFYGPKLEVTK